MKSWFKSNTQPVSLVKLVTETTTTPILNQQPQCYNQDELLKKSISTEQKTLVDQLMSKICQYVPDDTSPLTKKEIDWLDDDCVVRYLKATKWNLDEAGEFLLSLVIV